MLPKLNKTLAGLVFATAIAMALVGCKGSDGSAGATGPAGPAGATGATGATGNNGSNGATTSYVVNANALTSAQWIALNPVATVTSVDWTKGAPVVNFKITDANGDGIKGLETWTVTKTGQAPVYANFAFHVAKLVPASGNIPSRWVSYMISTVGTATTPAKVQAPNAEAAGTMVGNGDGTYTYTFNTDITKVSALKDAATAAGTDTTYLDDVSYQSNLPHRLVMEFYGNMRGYGIGRHANTPDGTDGSANAEMAKPLNVIYDIIPATNTAPAATDPSREIAVVGTCNTCHTSFNYHGGHRLDPRYCTTCHTDQQAFGQVASTRNGNAFVGGNSAIVNGTSELNFRQLVHQIHMGDSLQMTGHDLNIDSNLPMYADGGIPVTGVTYPQSAANCSTCHVPSAATPQAGNWQTAPSRAACGGCHDSVDFTTGNNHGPLNGGGIQTSDANCATSCHTPQVIALYHVPFIPVDPNNAGLVTGGNAHTNASFVASGTAANVPSGAAVINYNLKSFSVNASGQPVWVFQFLNNGKPVVFNTFNAATTLEMMNNFVGGPNLYAAFGVPQDGIANPVDYNSSVSVNLHKLWRGGAAAGSSFTGPDANGFYTATLAGVTIPSSATLVTGGIGYFYGVVAKGTAPAAANTDSLPITETDLAAFPYNPATYQGGLSVPPPNVWAPATGSTPRRAIVAENKCNSCHEQLGTFTDHNFHAGQRNDAPTCTFCHHTNTVDTNDFTFWNYNIKEAVHALHASSKRTTPYTWSSADQYWNVTYPAQLNNCEACHLPGTYDLSASDSSAAMPSMLWTTVAAGTQPIGTPLLPTLAQTAGYNSALTYGNPYVVSGTNYGGLFAPNTTTAAKANVKWPSAGTTLLTGSLPVGAAAEADPTTLVSSPITSACFACHDSSSAKNHMVTNGGSLYVPRSSVVTPTVTLNGSSQLVFAVPTPIKNSEACMVCHGTGAIADIKTAHMTF